MSGAKSYRAEYTQINHTFISARADYEHKKLAEVALTYERPGGLRSVKKVTPQLTLIQIVLTAAMVGEEDDRSGVFKVSIEQTLNEYIRSVSKTLSSSHFLGYEQQVPSDLKATRLNIQYKKDHAKMAEFKFDVDFFHDIIKTDVDTFADIRKQFSNLYRRVKTTLADDSAGSAERADAHSAIKELTDSYVDALRIEFSLRFNLAWNTALISNRMDEVLDLAEWMFEHKNLIQLVPNIENYAGIFDPEKTKVLKSTFKGENILSQFEAYTLAENIKRMDVIYLVHHLIEAYIEENPDVFTTNPALYAKFASAMSKLSMLLYAAQNLELTLMLKEKLGESVESLEVNHFLFASRPPLSGRRSQSILRNKSRTELSVRYFANRLRRFADELFLFYESMIKAPDMTKIRQFRTYLCSEKIDVALQDLFTKNALLPALKELPDKHVMAPMLKSILLVSNLCYRAAVKVFSNYRKMGVSDDEFLEHDYHETVGYCVKVEMLCLDQGMTYDRHATLDQAKEAFLRQRTEYHRDQSLVSDRTCLLPERWCPKVIEKVYTWLVKNAQFEKADSYAATRIQALDQAYKVMAKLFLSDAAKMKSIDHVMRELEEVKQVDGINILSVRRLSTPRASIGSRPLAFSQGQAAEALLGLSGAEDTDSRHSGSVLSAQTASPVPSDPEPAKSIFGNPVESRSLAVDPAPTTTVFDFTVKQGASSKPATNTKKRRLDDGKEAPATKSQAVATESAMQPAARAPQKPVMGAAVTSNEVAQGTAFNFAL